MQGGFYYSLVFEPVQKKVQFSTIFFSTCPDDVIAQRAKDYMTQIGYSDYRVVGPFNDAQTAEDEKENDKKQWIASGYDIDGDTDFIGDCYAKQKE
jgi:hypothetical protein